MEAATTPSNAYSGYGYLWWLRGGGAFNASGVFGQGIYINPEEDVVIAIHSARANASRAADWAWMNAMYEALTEALAAAPPKTDPGNMLRKGCFSGRFPSDDHAFQIGLTSETAFHHSTASPGVVAAVRSRLHQQESQSHARNLYRSRVS
jgi:hypothetical protein